MFALDKNMRSAKWVESCIKYSPFFLQINLYQSKKPFFVMQHKAYHLQGGGHGKIATQHVGVASIGQGQPAAQEGQLHNHYM